MRAGTPQRHRPHGPGIRRPRLMRADGTLLCCQGEGWQRGELVVEVAGEHAFDAASGFAFGLAGREQALVVGGGLGVPADAAERDDVEGAVELAVAATIEPVALLAAAGGVDRAGAGEGCEGGLADHAGWVAAGDDELCGADGA